MTDTLIIRDPADTLVIEDDTVESIRFDDAPGPPGRSITVHWSTQPPTPGDGAVGDLWIVTAE